MTDRSTTAMTAGEAIFPRLQTLGIDYVFVNSGTDFPPIIEGLAKAAEADQPLPRAVVVPHEHAAMGMAHGYYLMSGRAQAVMLHTNVGLANGAIGALNAACDHVPMLLMSGRTPATEQDRFGARTVPIGWGQEMRDQTALVREACKWDYELRFPEQIEPMLDRGFAIANSTPKGPVYLSLPREVLSEDIPVADGVPVPPLTPVAIGPDDIAIATAAAWIADARQPLVIAQRGAGNAETFATFSDWVDRHAIAVSSWWATHLALATDHPCHIGQDPGAAMAEADVVIVLDCLAPWWPDKHRLHPDARVIHIGPDPLFSRTPTRGFRCDLAIAGETDATLPRLMTAVDRIAPEAAGGRRELVERLHAETTATLVRLTAPLANGHLTKARVSHLLGAALADRPSTVFSELGTMLGPLPRCDHRSWFQEPHSGGLGWSFPAAMGAKLAAPERTIVATLGDGSYMFANPTACHQIAESLGIAIIVLILNNAEWGAVRQSVKGLYPSGRAARVNAMPLTGLSPSPDFTKTAQASRAWTASVDTETDLIAALSEALRQAQAGTLALIDAKVLPD